MSNQHFPTPKIPPSALLDASYIGTKVQTSIPTILQIKNSLFTTSGRASIALALEHANISPGDEILIPAYHCEAMVAPAKWRQAKIVFYRIKPDTKADVEDIQRKITHKMRAILVTHYFGFEQDLQVIRQICDKYDLILIEDCAHAMFGLSSEQAIGTTGDYAIGSSMKFLPMYEGGLLSSTKHNLSNIKLSSPSIKFQIKSIINTFEVSIQYKRFGIMGYLLRRLLGLKDNIWNTLKKTRPNNNLKGIGPSSSEGGFGLDEEWIHKGASYFSRRVANSAPLETVIQLRRKHYQKMLLALSDVPNIKILFQVLPHHTVPWVFPVYVNQPEKFFPLLKMQGIPVWRFGEFLDKAVTSDICPTSCEYSKHIFQFPCHQSLLPHELDWMLNQIKIIFNQ